MEWTSAFINELPDSSFAYIESGGKKDKDGRTVPRSLRHLPYKNKNGDVDPAHVRNALARLPQTKISESVKAGLQKKLENALTSIKNDSMQTVTRFDSGRFNKPVRTPQGYLRAMAMIARVGVLIYKKGDGSEARELVLPEELYSKTSTDSLMLIPMCDNHPPVKLLDTKTTKMYQIGYTGETIEKTDGLLGVPATITDETALKEVENGKEELSAGYQCELEIKAGLWQGQPYDAIQRNRIYNHIAIVDKGRAGDEARLRLDSADGEMVDTPNPKKEENKMSKQVEIDGKKFDIDDDDLAGAIESLQAKAKGKEKDEDDDDDADMMAKKDAQIKELKDQLDKMCDKKDKSEAKADSLDAELKKLRSDSADTVKINEMVKARIKLVAIATKACPKEVVEKFDTMNDLEIKKAVILAKQPEAKIKLDSATEVYVEARFDSIADAMASVSGADAVGSKINGGREQVHHDGGSVDLEAKRAEAIAREDKRSTEPLGKK